MTDFNPDVNPLPSVIPGYLWTTVRTIGAFAGGWVVSKGWFTAHQLTEFAGVAVMLATWGFGMWNAHHANNKLKAAIVAPAALPS